MQGLSRAHFLILVVLTLAANSATGGAKEGLLASLDLDALPRPSRRLLRGATEGATAAWASAGEQLAHSAPSSPSLRPREASEP